MTISILRAADLHNTPSRRGKLNISKSFFYDVIEPQLEKVKLSAKAIGYTDRSVDQIIKQKIVATSKKRR